MQFDYSRKLDTQGLSGPAAVIVKRKQEERRKHGLAVQFIKDDGSVDEWTFARPEYLKAFTDKLAAKGVQYITSQNT